MGASCRHIGHVGRFSSAFGLAALLWVFEIVDDVSTLSSMLIGFYNGLEEERPPEGAVHRRQIC